MHAALTGAAVVKKSPSLGVLGANMPWWNAHLHPYLNFEGTKQVSNFFGVCYIPVQILLVIVDKTMDQVLIFKQNICTGFLLLVLVLATQGRGDLINCKHFAHLRYWMIV